VIPQRPLGRDIWNWATALQLDKVTTDSRLGKRLAGRDQVIGPGPRQLARHHGIGIRPRAACRAEDAAISAAASADALLLALTMCPTPTRAALATTLSSPLAESGGVAGAGAMIFLVR
jgi:hypothetical protein